jgi:DNA-directed RNA polymerase subunit RPC12/RpoP
MSQILYHCRRCQVTLTEAPEPIQTVEGWRVVCPECGSVTSCRNADISERLLTAAFELEVL